MNKRIVIGLVIAAGGLLLIVLILLLIAFLRKPQPTETEGTNKVDVNVNIETTTTTTNTGEETTTNVNTNTPPAAATDDRSYLSRLARNFTERYGSYSTDTNYENIERTRSFMTAKMLQQADQIISQNKQEQESFYSVETVVTTVTISDFSDGATGATIIVDTRQATVTGQSDPVYQNRRARLTMIKDGASWKVDSFRWL